MESASKAGFSWPHLKAWNSQLGLLEVHAGLGLGGSTLIISVMATRGASKPQGCVGPPAALPGVPGELVWNLPGSVGRGTFQPGHCAGDRSSWFHFSLSGSAVRGPELLASLPHAGPSPSRGHRREVTLQSVPVNENLLSVSCEPSQGSLLGGVGDR